MSQQRFYTVDELKSLSSSTKAVVAVDSSAQKYRTQLGQAIAHPIEFSLEAIETSFKVRSNQYELFDHMADNDDNIAGCLLIQAGLVKNAYKGIEMRAGGELDEREHFILNIAEKYADKILHFNTLISSIAKKLLKHGNSIYLKVIKPNGYPGLQYLPIDYMTVLQRLSQLNNFISVEDAQVWLANYYVLNELENQKIEGGRQEVYTKDQVLHFQVNEGHDVVTDMMGRWTSGVMSIAPFKPLVPTWWWKQELIWTDMLSEEQTQPFQHHQLNLDWINEETIEKPEGWAKSLAEYIAQVKLDYITDYKNLTKNRKPDEAVYTDDGVTINMIEREYQATNPLEKIKKIEIAHAVALGVPMTATSDTGSSFAGDITRTSIAGVVTKDLVDRIFPPLLAFLQEILMDKYPQYRKQIMQLGMNTQLSLDKDHDQMMRRASVAHSLKLFHPTEMRRMAGFPVALTDVMKKEMESYYERIEQLGKDPGVEKGATQSPKKKASEDSKRSPSQLERPETSQSKLQKQQTS